MPFSMIGIHIVHFVISRLKTNKTSVSCNVFGLSTVGLQLPSDKGDGFCVRLFFAFCIMYPCGYIKVNSLTLFCAGKLCGYANENVDYLAKMYSNLYSV